MHHLQVAAHRGAPAHHHADHMDAAAHHRMSEIEAAGAGIAGLDAVGAGIAADQIVMGGIIDAFVVEARQREIGEILRIVIGQMARQHRQIRWRW